MKVLAINIAYTHRHERDTTTLIEFPLGLAYIISAVKRREKSASIKVLDLAETFIVELPKVEEMISREAFSPDIVLMGGMVTRYDLLKGLARIVKERFPSATLICGGSVAATAGQFLMRSAPVDIAVVGEGDKTIVELLSHLPSAFKVDLASIDGIIFRGDSYADIVSTKRREPIKDLDSIDFPSYDSFNTERYIESGFRFTGQRYLPIITSRGCPFNCSFCYRNFGRLVRKRSVDNVLEEITFLKSRYRLSYVVLWDEIQLLDKKWVAEFAEKLLERGIGIKWICSSRVSLITGEDIPLLRLLKRAGLSRVSYGIESGSQTILDAMNKGTSIEQAETALRVTRKAGIKATGSLLIGYPGETLETIQETVQFCQRNLLATTFYILVPTPGTTVYDYCLKSRIITDEEAYLNRISQRGDASAFHLNLTGMDDNTFQKVKTDGEQRLRSIALRNYLKYYGFQQGISRYLYDLCLKYRRRLLGIYFDAP